MNGPLFVSDAYDRCARLTYLFGAVCPDLGTGAVLVLPTCNSEAMRLHLNGIADRFMQITLQRGETPSVFVTDPELSDLAGGRPLPHVYHDPLRLFPHITRNARVDWHNADRSDVCAVGYNVALLF